MARTYLLLIAVLAHPALSLDPVPIVTKPSGSSINANAGTNFELRCDVTNRRGDLSTRWEYMPKCTSAATCLRSTITDGQGALDQQKYGLRFVGSDTYILIIKNINLIDAGTYYCSIQINRISKVEDSVYVQVVQPPVIDPLQSSSSMTVDVLANVPLSCVAQGIPTPIIRWERAGGSPLPTGSLHFEGNVLQLNSVKPAFEGPYVCTASNGVGKASLLIHLSVRYKPQITADEAQVEQAVGYQVKMYCSIAANPAPDLIWWTRDGIDVTTLSRFSVTTLVAANRRRVTKLVVTGGVTQADYSSKFRCHASNDIGEDFALISIVQASNPLPIAGKLLTAGAVTAQSSNGGVLITLASLATAAVLQAR